MADTPRKFPQGFFEVITSSRMDGTMAIYGYGHHDKAINPGDLVIISTDFQKTGFKTQKIEASIKLRGRDIHLFAAAAIQAMELYEQNKDWLEAPASKPQTEDFANSRLPMAALTHWQQSARRAI